MSFLVDPPLLVGSGIAIEAAAPDGETARRLETAVLVVFLATSISLYLNGRWTHWLARLCRARNGRDWMINSGVFRFDSDSAGATTHAVSAAIFITYPLWIHVGRWIGATLGVSRRAP